MRGCAYWIIAAGGAFVLVLVLLVGLGQDARGCGSSPTDQPSASNAAEDEIPSNYLKLYQAAGQRYGIPWNLLAAIGSIESSHGRNPGTSSAGARGPMQFEPSTWVQYGVDGDGDGRKDIMNPADAIPAAARYLKASGAPGDIRKAVFAYNHSNDYVNDVLARARRYGSGDFATSADNNAAEDCTTSGGGGGAPATLGNLNGSLGERIVGYASKWLGTVYQFGGGNPRGPTVGANSRGDGKPGFDCSGLTLYAVYQATGGKITLPHYVPDQWKDPHMHRVPFNQLAVGDLVALDRWGHVGIYIGGGRMIHAPHTGDVVKISDISRGYYRAHFVIGGRVIL